LLVKHDVKTVSMACLPALPHEHTLCCSSCILLSGPCACAPDVCLFCLKAFSLVLSEPPRQASILFTKEPWNLPSELYCVQVECKEWLLSPGLARHLVWEGHCKSCGTHL
jgi:hypothetical protein